jgi:deoxyribodipyrimidine photolyase
MINIFLFHRDLRIHDNTTLINQIINEEDVIPIFIFTPEQINKNKNKYFSNNAVQFMIESLHELSNEIKANNYETNIQIINNWLYYNGYHITEHDKQSGKYSKSS